MLLVPTRTPTRLRRRAIASAMLEALEKRTLLTTIPTVPVPVAHWTFDEGTGTTAADSTGNGHTATLGSTATWAAGNVGTNAVKFNGTANSLATITGPVVDTAQSFTVSAWVNLVSPTGYQTFVAIAGTKVAGFFLQIRGDTGAFSFARIPSDNTVNATIVAASSAPLAGTWYHVVGVSDAAAGTIALYVDGTAMGSAAFTSGWTATGNTLIGHGFYNSVQADDVNGSVDDVQFFSSALSAAQVAALDQPAAYDFEEGSGAVANDDTGHGNNLQLGTAATWGAGRLGMDALVLNGTAQSVSTVNTPVLNTAQPFSVSAWVNLSSTFATQTLVSIDGANASGFYLQYRSDTGKFAFTRLASDNSAAQSFHADATNSPTLGTWYNLIGVNDVANSRILLYVNGVLQSSVTYTGGWQAGGATVIGGDLVNGARSDLFHGSIDDLHFYNSPLAAGVAGLIGSGGASIVTINPAQIGPTVSPTLFGAFMEDINYGGEGGIYDDEVRNSGFNDSTNALNAWAAVTSSGVIAGLASDATTGPTTALTESGKLTITSGVTATNRVGISNSGYFGVAVAPSTTYSVQFYAKASAGFTGPLTVDIESTAGTIYATATINSITTSWVLYTATLTTTGSAPTSSTNKFVISTKGTSANGATLWIGAAYLFPPSYEGASNHLRPDLMQDLANLHPAIFRVPGGNYLEGNSYATRFNWSTTIGPVQNRPGHLDSAWGYWSTDGMGLDEYLQMAEEIGAMPILAVYAGFTLTATGGSDTGTTLTNDVTDAINELHYVLDPVTTSWGAMRAANGHAAPYNVQYVEVGNEDNFSTTYNTRYPLFYDAIRAAFPSLQIIATTTSTGGRPYDVLDEHEYQTPAWFEANSTFYDNVQRGSFKVFVGEYASTSGSPTNNLASALGDASWLLGLERNSDLVTMSSYAPIWANVNGIQWTPDLIGFNNTTSYGSPSYYAQIMLNLNHGTQVIGDSVVGANGLIVLATRTGSTYYLTVVNTLGTANTTTINLNGLTTVSSTGTMITLSGATSTATNSITNPTNIVPVTSSISGLAPSFSQTFAPNSLTIIEFTASAAVPTVATPAAAAPTPVAGTTTNLSVLGADVTGEANLIYTWSTTGTPPAPVIFSVNSTNAAKNTLATFTAAGTYHFSVLITNGAGLTATSTVDVIVNQTLTGLNILPGTMTLAPGATVQLAVNDTDQFGTAMSAETATWSIFSGAGGVTSSGLFTAPAGNGVTTVSAITAGGKTAYATITIMTEVAWYQANATSGTTLADSSGNSNNGTLTGAAGFGAGISGNALSLTGGYASLPTGIVSTLTDFTIAAWIKMSSLSNWMRVFDFGTGQTFNMFLTPSAGGTNAIRFAITTGGGGTEQRLNGPAVALNTWTHIAVTLAGTNATLYVNGVAVATNNAMTLNPASLGNTNLNYLGKSQYGDPLLLGSIDDFRIVGRALSAAEILLLASPAVVAAAGSGVSPVTGISTTLSSVGSDITGGESSLTYTWTTTGTPPAPVTFSVNGTNAAKNTTATFTAAGTYNFLVTIKNAGNQTTTSALQVIVNQTATSLLVSPPSPTVSNGQTQQLSATVRDQFNALIASPTLAWSLDSGSAGGVNSTGLYTAPTSGPGAAIVRATAGATSGTAAVTVNFTTLLGSGANNTFRLARDAADTSLLDIYYSTGALPGTPTWSVAYSSVTNLVTVLAAGGNIWLILDYTNGSPIAPGGLAFNNNQTVTGDTLEVKGASSADAFTLASGLLADVTTTVALSNTHNFVLDAGTFSFASDMSSRSLTLNSNAEAVIGTNRALGTVTLNTGSFMEVAGTNLLLSLDGLTFSGGSLDLQSNDLLVHSANINALSTAIHNAYDNGLWNVAGLTSSSAAANPAQMLGLLSADDYHTLNGASAPFDAQTVVTGDALIKYTWFGDANFSGTVDLGDYAQIDNGFYQHLSGWVFGDFDYDGQVTYQDYSKIDSAFSAQSGPPLAQSEIVSHTDAFGSDYTAALAQADESAPVARGSLIKNLYHSYLHRAAETQGFDYWMDRLSAGLTGSALSAAIDQSTEHQMLQINALYEQLLGRQADTAGLAAWLPVAQSSSLADVQAGILASDEYYQRIGADHFIASLYRHLLNRTPDADAATWQAFGNPSDAAVRQAIIADILQSPEFTTL